MLALVVQNIDIEGPGLLQPVMERAGWDLDIRMMDQPGAVLPESLEGYGALVVLGGPMNVYEIRLYPYLEQVETLIRDAVDRKLPTLGLCLGGQLIAKSLGAPVTRNPVREIGWYGLEMTDEGLAAPLFEGLPRRFPVFQWHGDTFALPRDAVHLATSKDCVNQAFSYGQNVFALQFHLEVTPEIIESWSRAYADELEEFGGPGAPEKLVADTQKYWGEYSLVAKTFLANWIKVCHIF